MSDTLGPLTAEFNGHFWDVMHDKTGKVGDTCAAGYDGVTDIPNLENGEAYARLFAAAPDLLEALKYARRFLRGYDHDVDYVDAAIAKADGRS